MTFLESLAYFRKMVSRWKTAQWFEALWWRRYLKNKPVEEYLEWKKNYWKRFLENTKIKVGEKETLLDAGCGPAGIFMVFPKNEVWAIDPLLEKYDAQLPHFQKDKFPNVHFENTALESFSFPEKFDHIFCLNAINHVSDMETCLKNLFLSLRENGRLYLSVDAHNHVFLKKIFRLIPGDILHPHQMDLGEYVQLTERVGFQVERKIRLKKETIFDYHLIISRNRHLQVAGGGYGKYLPKHGL